jgi:hypothetical protein
MNRTLQLSIIAAFLFFTFAQLAAFAIGLRGTSFENRALATLPSIDWRAYSENGTSEALSAYLRDQLPLRHHLVAAHNRFVYEVFADSPVAEVRLGKQGWWFLTSTIEAAPCAPEADPERLIPSYESFIDAATAAGKTPLVVFSPDKAEMYPEYLADRDRARYEACAEPRRAQLEQRLTATSGFLNLWQPLREEKQRLSRTTAADSVSERLRFLFRPRDRHWHFETGRLQAREIVNAVSPGRFERTSQPAFPTRYLLMRAELSRRFLQFELLEPYSLLGDLPETLTLEQDASLGSEHVIRRYHLDDPAADPRSVLVVHDSFIYTSYAFIASNFRQATFIHWEAVKNNKQKIRELAHAADVIVLQSVDSNRGVHDGEVSRLTRLLAQSPR